MKQIKKMEKAVTTLEDQVDDMYTEHLDRGLSKETMNAVLDMQGDLKVLKDSLARISRMYRTHK